MNGSLLAKLVSQTDFKNTTDDEDETSFTWIR